MTQNAIWVLACLTTLAGGCKKEDYPEEKTQLEPENIFFAGTFGDQAIDLKIGTDDYYCYSSYRQAADCTYVFEGELRRYNCSPCANAFRIELSDYRKRPPGTPVPADSVFRTGNRAFIPVLSSVSSIKFVPYSNKAAQSFNWMFGNGTVSQDSAAQFEFAEPGPQTVSLTVHTKSNCKTVVTNTIFIDMETGPFACSADAVAMPNNSSQFSSSIIGGRPPFRHTWYFGDGSTSTLAAASHTYQWPGSYPVLLRVEDADQHVCESNSIYAVGNDRSSCTAKMALSKSTVRNAFLGGVKIQWTDASNTVFRSDKTTQPSESYFEVLDSQPYPANERGEAGRLLLLRFSVLLSDGHHSVVLRSDNTSMAVTYK